VACPFGRLVFTSVTPSYRPLSKKWTLPGKCRSTLGKRITPLSLGKANLAPPSKGNLPRAQVFPLQTPFTKGRPLTVFTHPMPSLGHR
jgi:hypothetical protein